MVVIVVSGKPGCGTSTVSKLLSEKTGLRRFSTGDTFKGYIKNSKNETDRSLEMWKTNKGASAEFHAELDKMAMKEAKKGNVVMDTKIGVRMLKDIYDFSVWLNGSEKARVKRYMIRDGIPESQAQKKLAEKDTIEREGWKRIYGFDSFYQENEADLVIDTTDKKPEEIVGIIIKEMKSRKIK